MVEKSGHGLVRELMRSQRFTLATLAVMLLLSLVTSGYLLLVSQPAVERYVSMGYHARTLHQETLHQVASLRGYVATGDRRFMSNYDEVVAKTRRAEAALLRHIDRDDTPGLTDAVLTTLLTRSDWQDWAETAEKKELPSGAATAFMLRGQGALRRVRRSGHPQHRDHPGPSGRRRRRAGTDAARRARRLPRRARRHRRGGLTAPDVGAQPGRGAGGPAPRAHREVALG